MPTPLPASDVVSVDVFLEPTALPVRTFGTLLIVGSSPVIDTGERIRVYSNVSQVADDFSGTDPEYLAAQLFFEQSPQPNILYVGRWAETATSGVLHGATLSAAQQASLLSTLQAISTGSLTISVDGTSHPLTGLDFTSTLNLNGVASVLETALSGAATVVWNATEGRFDVTSDTTGTTSSVGYATAGGSGTDVSGDLGLSQAGGAAAPIVGVAAETALAAATAMLDQSNSWYGLTFASSALTADDHVSVANLLEAANPARVYLITTGDPNSLVASSTTDVGARVSSLKLERTLWQYSTSSLYAAVSLFGRASTVDFTANNTVITLKFKTEPGVVAETLTESQAQALKGKNGNVFVNYSVGGGTVAIIQEGTMANGYFFDEVQGTDWLANNVQVSLFNALYTSPTKIPQTDPGMNQLANAIDFACQQGVVNGLIGQNLPWRGPPIGSINTGDILPHGWYVYIPPIASQSQSDRAARKSPPIQIAICLSGAVHFASALINVTR